MNRSDLILQSNTFQDKRTQNTIGVTMEESIELGIDAELDHILKPGWSQRLEYENDRFRVSLPQNEPDKSTARAELYSEVWRIARFVATKTSQASAKIPMAATH